MQLRSLNIATSIDVLPTGVIVEDRGPYVVVRSPSNHTHFWGNFLVYRQPPRLGDRVRWEADFTREIAPGGHLAFTWDDISGATGEARAEFVVAGYELEEEVALVATPQAHRAHARASDDVFIRSLDPTAEGPDEAAWAAVVELQVATREPGHTEAAHRAFVMARQADHRRRFRAGDGAWFVAETAAGELAATCGVYVTNGRGRYQAVDTAEPFRRRGIASRLVHDAGAVAIERMGAEQLVIVADANYHALPLYESLGFVARERLWSMAWWPTAPRADRHPTRTARDGAPD
ncbi:MAG: GCN5-related N-acetyltransferase [Thermoleophilia bacterium]|nr:GCN5-related N-acetyltransferase [Thermoleophilia bacterium]